MTHAKKRLHSIYIAIILDNLSKWKKVDIPYEVYEFRNLIEWSHYSAILPYSWHFEKKKKVTKVYQTSNPFLLIWLNYRGQLESALASCLFPNGPMWNKLNDCHFCVIKTFFCNNLQLFFRNLHFICPYATLYKRCRNVCGKEQGIRLGCVVKLEAIRRSFEALKSDKGWKAFQTCHRLWIQKT